MSRLLLSQGLRSLTITSQWKHSAVKNVVKTTAIRQQKRLLSKSGEYVTSTKNDFREMGKQNDAGALQDLLRRVQEIDSEITNTPIEEFKPNTQRCVAYCVADKFNMINLLNLVSDPSIDFKPVSDSTTSSNMKHLIDTAHGGDIFVFANGTYTCWGTNEVQESKFFTYICNPDICGASKFKETRSRENVEFIIDEDELTKLKGDVILLNPHVPSIELSKAAFSYGLGRAAKLTSIEYSMTKYLGQFDKVAFQLLAGNDVLGHNNYKAKNLLGRLLTIRKRMMRAAKEGFLGTPDFQWLRPELQDYVTQISQRFNTQARIEILNKQVDFAKEVTDIYEKYGPVDLIEEELDRNIPEKHSTSESIDKVPQLSSRENDDEMRRAAQ